MYTSISDLPSTVQHLPYHGKRIFLKVFNRAIETYRDESTAFRVAWSAVKRKYVKMGTRWVARADANEHDTTTDDDETDNTDTTESETE
ncbi:unknown [Helicoverpa armigera nucleopolyhedrovirus]|uniref:ChaB-like protein n=6 Tax=Alphabaculovirus helarmigerae TaxID=3047947 RepID=Q77K80_9ABAC|nr:hypothetical protein HanGV4gp052 [Helicoverpa armigera nucleopolyhedrovirus G4]NP_203607.1 hypothetical protein [Helicoverpa armigera nucleopolyhedrovirus]AAL56198.1 ORF53 [Helicoverpa zea single nucleopolyhedrovirus]AEN03976.1 hypothetical protein [Helicoverpa armigera NPV strain Australia]AIG63094.1 ORF52 [Helicoverpa SNPV AC53]AIG63231.1 ORF52 [Helicoverpa armigera SNPV]BAG74617.1 hypothetical protein [Helicoverpa armigera NPV NNg1]